MRNTSATRCHLHISPLHDLDVAHVVLVGELARDDVREDFEFSVWVGPITQTSDCCHRAWRSTEAHGNPVPGYRHLLACDSLPMTTGNANSRPLGPR